MLIGSPTNGSASCGRVVFPNLGYKKDAFLELSLVSNNSSSHPTNQHFNIPTLNISDFQQWPAPTTNSSPASPLMLLTLFPLGILLVLELLGFLLQWTRLDIREWLLCRAVKCARCSFSWFKVELTSRFRVDNHMFITTRGDCISRPPRRHPQQGRLGGPYLWLDEVGE